MNRKTFNQLIVVTMVSVALLCVSLVLLPTLAPKKAEASLVGAYVQYTWGPYNGVTTTQTGAGKVTADYGTLECYSTVDVTLAQRLTVTLQHSPNNSVWADGPMWQFATNVLLPLAGFDGQTADGTTFATGIAYGMYVRPTITISDANPVTVTLRCIAKDRTGSIDDDAGALEGTD